jgi:triosephosphate isomerase
MQRLKIAAGNWKMNTTPWEGVNLAKHISDSPIPEDVLVILGVPYTHLHILQKLVAHHPRVKISAQNCHEKISGAYTGEISAGMIHSLDVEYVILGHSERRQHFQESNSLLLQKIRTALDTGLKVIFCCGEELEIRKAGNHISHVETQLKESLFPLSVDDMQRIIIAYEPVWAIGTGETATPQQAQEMHLAIRQMLRGHFGNVVAESTSILYGGSVKGNNAAELFSMPDVDGGLVGGASLNAEEFVRIIGSF